LNIYEAIYIFQHTFKKVKVYETLMKICYNLPEYRNQVEMV